MMMKAMILDAADDRKPPRLGLESIAIRPGEYEHQRVAIELRERGEALLGLESHGVDRETPRRPCDAITIKSHPLALAMSIIAL